VVGMVMTGWRLRREISRAADPLAHGES